MALDNFSKELVFALQIKVGRITVNLTVILLNTNFQENTTPGNTTLKMYYKFIKNCLFLLLSTYVN